MGQDGTSPLAIRALERMGVDKVFDADKVAVVMDHSSPSPLEGVSALHTMMREFGKQTGATVYDVGEGVCHQLIPEKGHVVPGDLMVGCDSHTCTYGAINVFSTGVGSTDGAAAMASGKLWFKVPDTMKVTYDGVMQPGVFSSAFMRPAFAPTSMAMFEMVMRASTESASITGPWNSMAS